jgi:hypothetical protein
MHPLVQLANRKSLINKIKDGFWRSIKAFLRNFVISRTIRVSSSSYQTYHTYIINDSEY